MNDGPSYFVLDDIEWPDETREPTAPRELVEQAQRLGARRKFLARGEGGFFSQYSEFPAGYTIPMHSHDHDEMIVILAGGCTMLGADQQATGQELTAHDSVVLHGGFEYGFTAGDDGLTFITIRNGVAETNLAK
jgi:quercetin dioxygenase-like cupin family protein